MTEESTCPICGTSFQVPPTRPNQICCSRECGYIYRKEKKEDDAYERIKEFMDNRGTYKVVDVLEGKLNYGTDNRMTVKGARHWEKTGRFIVLVAVDDK